MSEHSERDQHSEPAREEKAFASLEKRLPVFTGIVWLIMIAFSLTKADWRITTGIILGGALALLNYYWMKSSIAAVFKTITHGDGKPSLIARYILRYFAIVCAVVLANELKIITIPATIIGLCSFAGAVFLESFYQIYLLIVKREEN